MEARSVFSPVAWVIGFFLTASVALSSGAFAQGSNAQSNPAIGIWRLNVAKSTFTPGPPPKSQMRTVVAQGDSVRVTFDVVDSDGKQRTYSFAPTYDGKAS